MKELLFVVAVVCLSYIHFVWNEKLTYAIEDSNVQEVEKSVRKGVSLKLNMPWETSPLDYALHYIEDTETERGCRYKIVKLLIENGANPNKKSADSMYPILEAACISPYSYESEERYEYDGELDDDASIKIAKLLIESGIDTTIKNNDVETAYDYPISNGYIKLAKVIKQAEK